MPSDPEKMHDLVIIGTGPAGLGAAIMAASEGLDTVVIDGITDLGGQAASSTQIRNYPGFRSGITGAELMTEMRFQAGQGFGADVQAPIQAESIEVVDGGMVVKDDGIEAIYGRAIVVACGVQYRRHPARNMALYLRLGVSYGSPDTDSKYSGQNIYVVGGANSAGQAASHLSKYQDCDINMLVRRDSLADTMSKYLREEIEQAERVKIHYRTEILEASGDGRLEQITVSKDGNEETLPADRIFLMIGAVPKTNWLPEEVARDPHGFIRAGSDIPKEIRQSFVDQHSRPPSAHETCIPGLFVAGDVRSNTIKRVSSACADGQSIVPELLQYLGQLKVEQDKKT